MIAAYRNAVSAPGRSGLPRLTCLKDFLFFQSLAIQYLDLSTEDMHFAEGTRFGE